MIQDLEKIRFVTANYPRLKGLNMVVIGFWTLCAALWSSGRQGDLSGPILFLVLIVILSIIVERYYRRVFGRVRSDQQIRRRGIWTSLVFGLLGLTAYVVDTAEIFPFSAFGIFFALALGFDYWQINRISTEKYLAYYLWFVIGLLVVSLLPVFGLAALWNRLGFDSATSGILAFIGIMLIILGLLSHYSLVRALPALAEVSNDELI